MPRIPVLEQQVAVGDAGVPKVQLAGMNPAASGAGLAEAAAKTGAAVTGLGEKLAEHLTRQKHLDFQHDINERSAAIQGELQKLTEEGENGLLNKTLNNAKGIIGTYDTEAQKIVAKYTEGMDEQSANIARSQFSSHILTRRGAIARHEIDQTNKAQEGALAAELLAHKNDTIMSAKPEELITNVENGQDILARHLFLKGADEAMVHEKQQILADDYIKAAISAKKDNPREAEKLFNASAHLMTKDAAMDVRLMLDGKMIDVNRKDIWARISADPKSRSPLDGTYDLTHVDERSRALAKSMKLPEAQEQGYVDFARAQAVRADQDLIDTKRQNLAGYLGFMAKAKADKMDHSAAVEQGLAQFGGAFTLNEKKHLELQGDNQWIGDPENQKMRLKVALSDKDLAAGYLSARNTIIAHFGLKAEDIEGMEDRLSPGKLMLQRLDEVTPDKKKGIEITNWIKDQLKDVPTQESWLRRVGFGRLDKENTTWGSAQTPVWSEQYKLESQYGAARIEKVRQNLIDTGRPSDWQHIQAVLTGKK